MIQEYWVIKARRWVHEVLLYYVVYFVHVWNFPSLEVFSEFHGQAWWWCLRENRGLSQGKWYGRPVLFAWEVQLTLVNQRFYYCDRNLLSWGTWWGELIQRISRKYMTKTINALETRHRAPPTQGMLPCYVLIYASTYICTFFKDLFNVFCCF